MDPVRTQGHTRYGTVSNHGVTLGNIAGNHHEIIGTQIHMHTNGPPDNALPALIAELRALVNRKAENDAVSMRSRMTTYDDDDKQIWREFRRELIGQGFRSADIRKHTHELKEYLSKLRQEKDKYAHRIQIHTDIPYLGYGTGASLNSCISDRSTVKERTLPGSPQAERSDKSQAKFDPQRDILWESEDDGSDGSDGWSDGYATTNHHAGIEKNDNDEDRWSVAATSGGPSLVGENVREELSTAPEDGWSSRATVGENFREELYTAPEDRWSSRATVGAKTHPVRPTTVGRRQSPWERDTKPLANGRNTKITQPNSKEPRQSSKTQPHSRDKQRSPHTQPYRRHVRLDEDPVSHNPNMAYPQPHTTPSNQHAYPLRTPDPFPIPQYSFPSFYYPTVSDFGVGYQQNPQNFGIYPTPVQGHTYSNAYPPVENVGTSDTISRTQSPGNYHPKRPLSRNKHQQQPHIPTSYSYKDKRIVKERVLFPTWEGRFEQEQLVDSCVPSNSHRLRVREGKTIDLRAYGGLRLDKNTMEGKRLRVTFDEKRKSITSISFVEAEDSPSEELQSPWESSSDEELLPKTQPENWPELKLLTWELLPKGELTTLLVPKCPMVPEGWDRRVDGDRIFYVDTYARGDEKRCFWLPPKEEVDSVYDIPGWEKVSNIFGRISWLHQKSNLRSYQFPATCLQIKYTDDGELYVEQDGIQYWGKDDLSQLMLDDADVACQITHEVWKYGLSDEAVALRGDLWWGSEQVLEYPARFSKHRPPQAVTTEPTSSEGTEGASKQFGTEISLSNLNEIPKSTECDATQSSEQGECAREARVSDNRDNDWNHSDTCSPTQLCSAECTEGDALGALTVNIVVKAGNKKASSNYRKPTVEDVPDEYDIFTLADYFG